MNIEFQIEKLVPRFLLNEPTGYALAKAIEKCFQIVARKAQDGLDIIQDPAKMPEWRLDEMAREYGCLYDFGASIEQKRYWISNAIRLYTLYGTPKAIITFLEGAFSSAEVEENWLYSGGEPFHFRVIVSGDRYDAERIAWAQKVVAQVKNVRSILDSITIDSSAEIVVSGGADHFAVPYLRTAEELLCGDEYGQEL